MLSTKSTPLSSSILPKLSIQQRGHHLVSSNSRRLPSKYSRRVRMVASRNDQSVSTVLPAEPSAANSERRAVGEGKEVITVRAVLTVRKKMKERLSEKVESQMQYIINGMGMGITVQLVSEEIDPDTKTGRRSSEAAVRGWLPKPTNHPANVAYAADLTMPSDFGCPGAVIITNLQKKEFHLLEIAIHGFPDGPIFFPANTWFHSRDDNPESRVLFSNRAYLPSQTPAGLKDLRQVDLSSICGDGKGERQKFERIYDYATYNDLGNPDKDNDLGRPVLGGAKKPYPRRCRTGRPPAKSDLTAEARVEKPHPVYVPRDENFEEIKQNTFSAGALRALFHNLIPALKAALSKSDSQFECFSEIDSLYKEGVILSSFENKATTTMMLPAMLKSLSTMSEKLMKYEVPSIISRDRFSWLRDNEFARQALAGVNPVDIQRLREFPIRSKLDPKHYGPQESAITKEILEHELNGLTLDEAIKTDKLYIIDYHDILLPYIGKINSLKGRKAYASRTIFLLTHSGTLRPIVIELSLPPSPSDPSGKRVYTHGHDATTNWIWKLAKAHACANDAGVHQLVNHWLRTHACMEPYIIATHRRLSYMHPIFKLLQPHMRYTMEINALARQSLINGGGIIENCFSPGKYSLEFSSAAYKSVWRFDTESLPADLLQRGMAVEDPSMPCGIKLVIEDYPYAADGLLVWSAIEDWVTEYVSYYYPESNFITSDVELQAWWDEIKNKGHPDKKNEPWWPKLETKEDLVRILSTIIWTASGKHASINFGQYPFGGYMPNRPTLMKKLIPQEDEPAYEDFLLNPQKAFLSSVPSQLQATQVMAVQDTLSTHSPDEEYLGQQNDLHVNWTSDKHIVSCYEKFEATMEAIEQIINKRNKDFHLKNRTGAGVPPYELLLPSSGPGVTGRGIPNSISI